MAVVVDRSYRLSIGLLLVAALARGESVAPDPLADRHHAIALDEATRGLVGSGPPRATIEFVQAGHPLGALTCTLFADAAPKTVANFVGLSRGVRPFFDRRAAKWVQRPFYDGLLMYRVIPGLMIQGGSPSDDGNGDPGYTIEDELAPKLAMDHAGVLAMANRGPGTAGSQFFVTEVPAPWLTGLYTIFGRCTPIALVEKIAHLPTGNNQRPREPITIAHVRIARAKKK